MWVRTILVTVVLYAFVAGPVLAAPVTTATAELSVSSIAASTDGNTVFVVAGSGDGYSTPYSLYRTTNAAAATPTWMNLGPILLNGAYQSPGQIVMSPSYVSDHTIFSVGSYGILRSQNADGAPGTLSFTDVSVPSHHTNVLALSPTFGADHVAFAGTSAGLFRSINAANATPTWAQIDNAFVSDSFQGVATSTTFSTDQVLYAAPNYNGVPVAYRSQNALSASPTFVRIDDGSGPCCGGPVVVSPTYATDRTIFVGSARFDDANSSTLPITPVDEHINPIPSPSYATDHTCLATRGTGTSNVSRSTNCNATPVPYGSFAGISSSPLSLVNIQSSAWPTGTLAFFGTQGGGLYRSANITTSTPTYQQILALANAPAPPPPPTPTIATITPMNIIAGSSGFQIDVKGTNFISNVSVAGWNGAARATDVLSPTELFFLVTDADLANPGVGTITVANTGGGMSNGIIFTIQPKSVPATLSASPSPVPFGQSAVGITWSTGDNTYGEVWVSANGSPEKLFTGGASGTNRPYPFINSGTFVFGLYAGTGHAQLLQSVTVQKLNPKNTIGPAILAQPASFAFQAGVILNTTTILFDTGDGSVGDVYVSINDGTGALFTENVATGDVASGQVARWVQSGTYTFTLKSKATGATLDTASVTVAPGLAASPNPVSGGSSPTGTSTQITFNTGSGLPGAVCVMNAGGLSVPNTVSNSGAGISTLSGLTTGSYTATLYVSASGAAITTMAPGAGACTANVPLTPAPGVGTVTVTVGA